MLTKMTSGLIFTSLCCFSKFSYVSIISMNSSCNFKKIVNSTKRKHSVKYALKNLGRLGNTLKSPRKQSPMFVYQ